MKREDAKAPRPERSPADRRKRETNAKPNAFGVRASFREVNAPWGFAAGQRTRQRTGSQQTRMKTISLSLENNRPAWLLWLAGAGLMAGCASEPVSHVVSAPPPPPPAPVTATTAYVTPGAPGTTTTQTTQTTPTGTVVTTQSQPTGTIIVTQAPPALQAEVVMAQPSSSHVWVAGYWTWRNNQYQWMAGHWAVPPYAGAKWVAPRWQTENGAYRFYEGSWN